jgi:hypothetical protein
MSIKTAQLLILWALTALVAVFFCSPIQSQRVLSGKRIPVAVTEETESSAAIEQSRVGISHAAVSLFFPEFSHETPDRTFDSPPNAIDSHHRVILRI